MSGKRGGEEIGEGGRKSYEAKTVQCSLEGADRWRERRD